MDVGTVRARKNNAKYMWQMFILQRPQTTRVHLPLQVLLPQNIQGAYLTFVLVTHVRANVNMFHLRVHFVITLRQEQREPEKLIIILSLRWVR